MANILRYLKLRYLTASLTGKVGSLAAELLRCRALASAGYLPYLTYEVSLALLHSALLDTLPQNQPPPQPRYETAL